MRIVLLGHRDIASLFAMNRLAELLPEDEFMLFDSGMLTRESQPSGPLAELAAADAALCETFLSEFDIQAALRAMRALPTPNSAEGLAVLGESAPDLIVSIRYRRILRDDVIAIPAHGVLNLHSGILPDYRGVMATFWAMLHGAKEIGCTLHRIVDSGIDTGPVLGIYRKTVARDASYLANVLSLYPEGCRMIAQAIEQIRCGNPEIFRTQMAQAGEYFSSPDQGAVDEFLRKGLQLTGGENLLQMK
jgi:methionyl-tRNA formyltransferase